MNIDSISKHENLQVMISEKSQNCHKRVLLA